LADLLIEKLERQDGARPKEALLRLDAADRALNLFEMRYQGEGGVLYQ